MKVKFAHENFDMFVYKTNDSVSDSIIKKGSWEDQETKSILEALSFYSKKLNITKNDITIIDIGANIGWFSLILGKKGYKIISFEASNFNYYILLKNFCVNEEINMTIINEGLYNINKNWTLYHPISNIGNAYIMNNISNLKGFIKENIKLTKLESYIPFLKSKNIALIKLDIEGSEGKALEGGIYLITKYHIPFIFLEFSPSALRLKGSNPKLVLKMFINNRYSISTKNFLLKDNISLKKLLKVKQINIYLTYNIFLK